LDISQETICCLRIWQHWCGVGIFSNMKAVALVRRRVVVATDAFVEMVIWQLPEPAPPSTHMFKYRLAYIVEQRSVLLPNERFDRSGRQRVFCSQNLPRSPPSGKTVRNDLACVIGAHSHIARMAHLIFKGG